MPACVIGGEACPQYMSPVNSQGCPAGFFDAGVEPEAVAEAVKVAIKGVTRTETGNDMPAAEALYDPTVLSRQAIVEYGRILAGRVLECSIAVENFEDATIANHAARYLPESASAVVYTAMRRLRRSS